MTTRYQPLLLLFLLLFCLTPSAIQAQTDEPATPEPGEPAIPKVHVVQPGETLTSIATLYETTVETLQRVNNISDPSLLYAGQELLIPGGTGQEVLTFHTVQLGDTLDGLAEAFNTTVAAIAQTNRLVHPDYLVAGQTIGLVSRTGSTEPRPLTGRPHLVEAGETPLMIAARYNLTPAALAETNDLTWPPRLYPGQRLRLPGEQRYQHLSGEWALVEMRPLPAVQGETVAIYVETLRAGRPSGYFAGQPLRFAPHESGFVALAGLDAFTDPGFYTVELEGSGDRPWRPYQQAVAVTSSNYGTQLITVPPEIADLLAPEVRSEEDDFLATLFSQFSETQLWDGLFQMPLTTTIITDGYGGARSYNGGPFDIFHTGVDFAAPVGTPVLAAAEGRVVFSDALPLRGNSIIIDHGMGVMTGYFHLSTFHVTVGETVTTGQTIAEVGSTGLSSGPHLHWDLRIINAPVNGLQWTRELFP